MLRLRNHDQMLLVTKKVCRKLRKRSTPAERLFWNFVRNRRFLGLKFFRQYPLVFGKPGDQEFFVVDFYCYQLRLAVELDGKIHDTRKEQDAKREEVIRQMGVAIIRFKNEDIEQNLGHVGHTLSKIVQSIRACQFPDTQQEDPSFTP